jgi:hypothetical protein
VVILPGKRVPALRTNSVVLRDGLLVPVEQSAEVVAGALDRL